MIFENIENATLEAIYWWNRDEFFYHRYFSKLDKIYKDKPLLEFFTGKIFEVFLREYAIRRNLSAGFQSVDKLINELFEYGFVQRVKNGEIEIVDDISQKIKATGNSTTRQTKSLLSKVAFLINPSDFALCDNRAKESLWEIQKSTKRYKQYEINEYTGFINQFHILRQEIKEHKLFKNSFDILTQFSDTDSFKFFNMNKRAFEMRIVDKYLWLLGRKPNERKLLNAEYPNLNKLN
jgi:hypothetical protein